MSGESAFHPFELERMLSKFENIVEYNLSESGAHPLSLRQLLGERAMVEELLDTEFHYPQTNGILELRENIAAMYKGATPANVLVTVGAAEGNFISVQTLASPGDEVVVMLPNYMQIWGLASNSGMQVRTFNLKEERNWAPDLEELADAVTERTRFIAVCNPNNPTGYILTEAEMDGIVAAASRTGAWILADEVYSGAERLTEVQTPSFWGRYDKVLAVGSLSKAYALPGLRIGWVVAPEDKVDDLWARHEARLPCAGRVVAYPARSLLRGPAPGLGRRLCALPSRPEFDRTGQAAGTREERVHHSWRSFWPRSFLPDQLWAASRLPHAGP
jgi:aspartate/methionine/tyrosine aminotransferase